MDALVEIDQLGDADIGGKTAEHIGIVGRQRRACDDHANHPAERDTRGFVEIGIEGHRDEVILRLGIRCLQLRILDEIDLERAGEAGLDGGHTDFAIALHGVTVTAGEQATLGPDRKIENAACAELLVVDIAAKMRGHGRADPANRRFRRGTHHTEERLRL